jgi:transcriptional regulator with XRE-family HTH domain
MTSEFTRLVQLATDLAEEDNNLLNELVYRRRETMTQKKLAEDLGETVEYVEAFERYDSDPSLSEVRRYALAVGMSIRHVTTPVDHTPTKEEIPL